MKNSLVRFAHSFSHFQRQKIISILSYLPTNNGLLSKHIFSKKKVGKLLVRSIENDFYICLLADK